MAEGEEPDSYNAIVKGHIREAALKVMMESTVGDSMDRMADKLADEIMPIVENVISDLY